MSDPSQGGPRANQRSRTRTALLATAAGLVRAGQQPSVAEVAEAARISRRTAYRYFPSQEQLLTEAALEALRPLIEASFEPEESDPERRIEAVVRTMQRQAIANEHLLRTMIRLTVERGPSTPSDGPRRGSRRVDWLETAVAPIRARLGAEAFARLVSALSLCVGAEALIVLRDVRALDAAAAEDVSAWAARVLVRAALADNPEIFRNQ